MAGKDYSSIPASKAEPTKSTSMGGGADASTFKSKSSGDGSQDRIIRIAQETEPKPVTPAPMSGLQKVLEAYSKFSPANIFFNSDFINSIGDASKAFQNRAIAFDLQNRLENQYQKNLATGGVAPGAAQTQLSKDLQAARAGQFSQQEYQDRYAPQMNQPNMNKSNGGGNSSMNDIAPYAPYIVSGTAPPISSPAANWYSNLANPGFGNMNTNINSEYTKAQTAIASTLNNKGPLGQIAVTQSPFYDFLKKNNLDRGILQ